MKVVLLQDVNNVGKAGEAKDVSDGYARNFLLRNRLAVLSTPGAMKNVAVELETRVLRQARTDEELAQLAAKLETVVITLKAKVGATQRLYGSITTADIARGLTTLIGVEIDKRRIELESPIRELGSFDVAVRLGKELVPKIKVVVEEEKDKSEPEATTS